MITKRAENEVPPAAVEASSAVQEPETPFSATIRSTASLLCSLHAVAPCLSSSVRICIPLSYDASMPPSLNHPFVYRGLAQLPVEFFKRDPSIVAPAVLGCVLVSRVDGEVTAGRIVETEAYLGAEDAGSHAATKGITKRNAVMYGSSGTVYVYLTYGCHHLINLVCEPEGTAGAVLVRALEPLDGIEVMIRRRGDRSIRDLCSGPGKLASALGVDLADNGSALGVGRLAVYDDQRPQSDTVGVSGRIGLSEGWERPLRYFVEGSLFVSRGRIGAPRLPGTVHDPKRRKI